MPATKTPLYRSTRGYCGSATSKGVSFETAVRLGLAPDGGLFVPTFFPKISMDILKKWKTSARNNELTFQNIAVEVMKLYVTEEELPVKDLDKLVRNSYTTFRDPEVTPIHFCQSGLNILELFHGPTFAFKDVALQFLGNLFEYFISKNNDKLSSDEIPEKLTVLGATSGDTGSSAIYGMKGKANVDVFILFPEGRVSAIQEKQMTTVLDKNIHCLAVKGFFDDAQSIVKALFKDEEFRTKVSLSAVNSINFARILAQIVYYFYAYFKTCVHYGLFDKEEWPRVSFSVPTGNFGDILAGWYAKQMGLPVGDLIVATNANDILYRFFTKGEYFKPANVTSTVAPSMDICVSSNFERFLYHMVDEDDQRMTEIMNEFEKTGMIHAQKHEDLLERCQKEMKTSRLDDFEIEQTIKKHFEEPKERYLLDPHSACGVGAADKLSKQLISPVVCLACAHWGKFQPAVEAAIGVDKLAQEPYPQELEALKTMKTRKVVLDATVEAVKNQVLKTLGLS